MRKIQGGANPERRPLLRRAAITNQSAMMIVIHNHLGPIQIATTNRKIPRLRRRKRKNKKESLHRAVIARDQIESKYTQHLPCAHCKEEGHISSACPKRLLQQQKSRNAFMTMRRKREDAVGDKGKTGGDGDNNGKGVRADGNGTSDHDKPNPPRRMRRSVCRGPHRKPACPNLPCLHCDERGHVRHDCPQAIGRSGAA